MTEKRYVQLYGGGVPSVTPKAAYRRWRLQGAVLWAAAILLWLMVLGVIAAAATGVYLATRHDAPCQVQLGAPDTCP